MSYNNRGSSSALAWVAVMLTVVLVSTAVMAQDATYTTDADFDLGTLTNVNHDAPNNDQLQINTTTSTFPVLWIANAGEDSVSRIDTDANCEDGRYETWFRSSHLGNAFVGPAPSRTAVDLDGNVYVANRHFDGRPASVMKILLDGGIDRNGNGVIDTSVDDNGDCTIDRNDPAELIQLVDLNSNGIVDPNELADERVAWLVQVGPNSGLGRSLCIAPDGNIWLGLFNSAEYWQLDSSDGSVISGPHPNFLSNYGCLVDNDGTLYSANLGFNMGIFDTNAPGNVANPSHSSFGSNYGIALGDESVYLANTSSRSYTEYNKTTGVFSTPADVFLFTRGISVDGNGDIVLGQSTIYKFDSSDGSVIWTAGNPTGFSDQRGVIVDANNDVWVVNKNSANVTKFDGDTGAFLATVPVGNQPYTYSDATGLAAISTSDSGFWSVVNNGLANGIAWDRITWNSAEPGDSSVTVGARASDSLATLPTLAYTPVTNGASPLGLSGQYIDVRATLTASADGTSPILFDLSIFSEQQETSCDLDNDGDVDITDIKTIFDMRGDSVAPFEPPDQDGDGLITVLDARKCVLQCTRSNCQEPTYRGGPVKERGRGQ